MEFSVERQHEADGTVRLILRGEIDLAARDGLRAALDRERHAGTPVLVVLDQLEFIDSTGIAELVDARRRAVAAGAPFAVTPGTGHVRHVLWVSGLLTHLCGAGEGEDVRPILH
ncbi:MAG: anti-sigma factor antagonist [Solirubrobacteraceae bacterium]|jgi:anti-sigma B factor antagonist|nr:anti-sigma factor antagonist [Solirubrobacteraceae bacterium]